MDNIRATIGVPVSTDKINLGEASPMPSPFLIYAEPTNFCNLKCTFCPNRHIEIKNKSYMSMSTFEKIISDIRELPAKPKVFKFCGVGESLMHREIIDMIRLVNTTDSADRIILYSNGVLLTPELNLELVNAGLNQINISVEAIDDSGYMEFAGAKINFSKFVDNVRHLYENRRQLRLYVKIHDFALKDTGDRERFFNIFGNISDYISVEGISHIFANFDSGNTNSEADRYSNSVVKRRQVCAICFKTLNVNADGSVSPCSVDWARKVIVGDILKESLLEIWNGNKLRDLCLRFCNNTIDKQEACSDCCDYFVSGHEDLDSYATDIAERLSIKG